MTAAFLEGTNDFKQYCWLPKELGLDGKNKLRVEIIKALYGFGGNSENIGKHFTPMEQVYREIDLHDAVLVGQIRTRINLIKNNSSKRVRFMMMNIILVKNMLMIYSFVEFNSLITRDRVIPSFIQVRINQA